MSCIRVYKATPQPEKRECEKVGKIAPMSVQNPCGDCKRTINTNNPFFNWISFYISFVEISNEKYSAYSELAIIASFVCLECKNRLATMRTNTPSKDEFSNFRETAVGLSKIVKDINKDNTLINEKLGFILDNNCRLGDNETSQIVGPVETNVKGQSNGKTPVWPVLGLRRNITTKKY